MSDLEDMILSLADRGKLNHITLIYKGDGKRNHLFSAGYRDNTSAGYSMVEHENPVTALTLALKGRKTEAPKAPPKRSGRDLI